MMDDKDDKQEPPRQKPVAEANPKDEDPEARPAVQKLRLVTTEEERLAAEIEKLRR